MLWTDPTDPDILAAVADLPAPLSEEDAAQAATALSVASELLTLATGYKVHPVGEVTEEYVTSHANRLSLLWAPVQAVTKVVRVNEDETEQALPYRQVGQMIYLHFNRPASYSVPLWRTNWVGLGRGYESMPIQHLYRVTYQFANTVTPAAKHALMKYAHELYLAAVGDEDCELPERVTSITREGIGMQVMTPQDYLDKGRTGLPSVDAWLAVVNPPEGAMRGIGGHPSSRPSQVFTPDSPPGVGTRLRRLP